ncbi:copper amine oxidase N-terminal domain-containing protein [Paenibacillus campi]|uniref:copper amine oxidase N-terminal domain-containing protein n=1 Tax=Paenibacillus campi TaxID=3106031 RepID=UPI002AFFC58C|nr:copper amine oxidase N-terminal domain-containing protein [Paenibacillus sp. SGZ-1014]
MKKKISMAVLATALTVSGGVHIPYAVAATSTIQIMIDGTKLQTDQPAIMSGSRTMVPLRGVFEAMKTTVDWKQSTRTITASKNGSKVILPVGSKTATINGKTTTLDVPAKVINGRTMVPLRFVTEALGSKVDWNTSTQTVTITTADSTPSSTPTPTGAVLPVAFVNASVVGQQGNGSDIQVIFPSSSSTTALNQYRIFVAKTGDANAFTLERALTVPAANYQAVPAGISSAYTITLTPQSRDINGAFIQKGASYRVYVLAVGNTGYSSAMTPAQSSITLGGIVSAAATPNNVKITDVSDLNDGRDLSVSFDKASDESLIAGYRVFIVRTNSASSFNLSQAIALPAANYTAVSKTGSNQTLRLQATAHDTSGTVIQSGVSYAAYVLAVNSSNDGIGLSAMSNNLTLGNAAPAATITKVADVGNFGDGRDLQISFDKSSNESAVSGYRIFAVPSKDAGNFNLTTAISLVSARYLEVSKTGGSQIVTLYAGQKDSNGNAIVNDVSYRVYVMSRGASSYGDSLSAASSTITLTASSKTVGTTSGVTLTDVSDYGDARDAQITFTKASDETLVSQYRVIMTKASASLSLSQAQALTSARYTAVAKTGANLTLTLPAGALDSDGDAIKNGVAYRALVMAVGTGDAADTYTLSAASSTVTLAGNTAVAAVPTVTATNSGARGDASDMTVGFTAASDAGVSEYRVIAVRSDQASTFNLAAANAVTAANYTRVAKTGAAITQALTATTRDNNGNAIVRNVGYRIYVLTVADGLVRSVNALSAPSTEWMLTEKAVAAVASVSADLASNNSAIRVSFTPPANTTDISAYAIMLVPSGNASSFTLTDANRVTAPNYQTVTGATYTEWTFTTLNKDASGNAIRANVAYRAFVLSVANGSTATVNALSVASREATMTP